MCAIDSSLLPRVTKCRPYRTWVRELLGSNCSARSYSRGGGPVPLVIVNARQQGMIAFHAQPPDLPPVPLMDVGFAILCSLARHRRPQIRFLSIGSRVYSALLSGLVSRRRLALH